MSRKNKVITYPSNQRAPLDHFSYLVALPVIVWFAYLARTSTTLGDALTYRNYYEQLRNVPLSELMRFTNDYIGAPEPIVPLIYWLGAGFGVSLITISTIASALLFGSLSLLLWRHRVSVAVLAFLASGIYIQVLITNADRLKFGFLFFLLSLVGKGRVRWVAGALAIGSHFQMTFLYAALGVGTYWTEITESIRSLQIQKSVLRTVIIAGLIALAFFLGTQTQLQEKIDAYVSLRGVGALLQVSLAALLILTGIRYRIAFLAGLTILAIAILILGGQRLNLAVYAFVVIWFFRYRPSLNLQMVVFLSYFAVRGYFYFMSTLRYGNGYVSLPAFF